MVRFAQDYTDPGEGQGSSQAPPRGYSNPLHPPASATDEDRVVLPLGEGVLTQNLGIPVVVVVTKVQQVFTRAWILFVVVVMNDQKVTVLILKVLAKREEKKVAH